MRDCTQAHPIVPIIACVLYAVLIICGRAYFESRPPLSWRRALALWNFTLSAFSFIGMIRTAPQLIHNLYHMSLRDNICNNPDRSSVPARPDSGSKSSASPNFRN